MTIQDQINAINWWQKQEYFHSLTCGMNSRHGLLLPNVYIDKKYPQIMFVGLRCPICGYRQLFVPKCIYTAYYDYLKRTGQRGFWNKLCKVFMSLLGV